jgi:hypothetical protein
VRRLIELDCPVQPEERIGNVRVSATALMMTPRGTLFKPLPISALRLRPNPAQSTKQQLLPLILTLPHRPSVYRREGLDWKFATAEVVAHHLTVFRQQTSESKRRRPMPRPLRIVSLLFSLIEGCKTSYIKQNRARSGSCCKGRVKRTNIRSRRLQALLHSLGRV